MASTKKPKNSTSFEHQHVETDGAHPHSKDGVTLAKKTNALTVKLDHLKVFDALTENQEKFFSMYKGGSYFMGLFGSPGTGKTFCALYRALEEVLDKSNSFKQIVVVRSAVQTRDQGFVSGDLEEKQAIYEQPYKEICATLFGRSDAWDRLKEQQHARFITTTAIRGISIDDAIVIVDECANFTFHELNTVMSRVGYRSKIIFCGDIYQTDLRKSSYDVSGLEDFIKIAKSMKEFDTVQFTPEDICRSSLVKSWIIACNSFGYC